MRLILCFSSVLVTTLLVGCGQSGNLQLPSDPNYDKRARYMLYPNVDATSQSHKQQSQPAASAAASEVNEIQ